MPDTAPRLERSAYQGGVDEDFKVLVDEPGFTIVREDGVIRYQLDTIRHDREATLAVFRRHGLRVIASKLRANFWEYGQLQERSAFAEEEED